MRFYTLILVVVLLGSCITKRKIGYIQNEQGLKVEKISGDSQLGKFKEPMEHRIRPNDDLIINVSSFDDISFNYFSTQAANMTFQATNEMSINATSYTVDVNGEINFPVIGNVNINGLTLAEVREKLTLTLTPYFNQPNVSVKFAFKKITILGEVNAPGYYTYTKDQINIFEALAMARDLTLHGDRREVLLIRNENGIANKYSIDITDDAQVFGYNYFLQPGDVIYVRPRGSVKWREVAVPITLIFSTITTALLVLNAVRN